MVAPISGRAPALASAGGAIALSGLLFFLGTGEHPFWWAAWCAALVVLLAAARLPTLLAFAVGASAWFFGCLNMWQYTRSVLVVPNALHRLGWESFPLAILAFAVIPACAFGLAVVLFRSYARRGMLWQAALAFPTTWVSFEYLSARLSPHATFGNLAYSQTDLHWLVQIASATGVWGISFCVLFAAAAAAALRSAGNAKQKRALGWSAVAAFALVLGFGAWRFQTTPSADTSPSVRVALAASDIPSNLDVQEPGAPIERLLREYDDRLTAGADRGVDVVVLPEKLGVMIEPTRRTTDAVLQRFADRSRATVVAGLIRRAGPNRLNEARAYVPFGTSVLMYDKEHLVPRFESLMEPGTARTILRQPSGIWGIAICKDLDFPDLARQYGREHVGLLLVPAWDFGDDAWLHDRMAVMRGIESGFSIARSAKQGLLTVTDDRGRILAEQSSTADPMSIMIAMVPVRHDDTLYLRFGDWFAWLSVAAFVGCAAGIARRRLTL